MSGKKGLAIAIVGMLLVIASVILIYIMASGSSTKEQSIIQKGELAISFVHQAELNRKMMDVGISMIAQRAAYEIGKQGGGSEFWSFESPNISTLKNNLELRINSLSDIGKITTDTYTELLVDSAHVNINKYNETPCTKFPVDGETEITLIDSNCFYVNGNQSFVFTEKNIYGKINTIVSFDQNTRSSYFKLISIGRKIFKNETYRVLMNRVIISSLNSGTPFSVKDSSGNVKTGCTSTLKSKGYSNGTHYFLPIENLTQFSISCGLDEVDGLGSGVNLNNILNRLEIALESFYPLDFEITALDENTLEYSINDTKSLVPLKDGEESEAVLVLDSLGNSLPIRLGSLKLIFKLQTNI